MQPRTTDDLALKKLDTVKSIVPLFSVSKNLTYEILEVFEILIF